LYSGAASATPVAKPSLTTGSRVVFFGGMTTTKILWGQISLVLAIVLTTMWAATQWVAWKLGFQPQLGHPWFELGHGWPVYFPLAFFRWWFIYDAYAPDIFLEGGFIAASGGIISVVAALAMSVWRARERKDSCDLRVGTLGITFRNPRRGSYESGWCCTWAASKVRISGTMDQNTCSVSRRRGRARVLALWYQRF